MRNGIMIKNLTDIERNKRDSCKDTISALDLKLKIKLSLFLTKHHAMKTYWGSAGIAKRIL